MDLVFRIAAMLVLAGVMLGAGRLMFWLGSVWFIRSDVVPLAVQPFEVSHGGKVDKEEGKFFANRFIQRLLEIQHVLTADLKKDLKNAAQLGQFRIESVAPPSLNLAPDVPLRIDVEFKAFEVDVIGIVERAYKFFDRSDRLQVAVWVGDKIKLFASLASEHAARRIGPWWLSQLDDEQQAIDRLAFTFASDLYKNAEPAFQGLDWKSFSDFIVGLRHYQEYARYYDQNPHTDDTSLLDAASKAFDSIVSSGTRSPIVYSYLGSVRSLKKDPSGAEQAYATALQLNPNDSFARDELKRLQDAKKLAPVLSAQQVTLDELRQSPVLRGYVASPLPVARREIKIAVIGTGIDQNVADRLKGQLVAAESTVPNEPKPWDEQGHGTAIATLAAALAPASKIISIKSLSSYGAGTGESIAAGIRLAAAKQADILLLPLGSPGPIPGIEQAIGEAAGAGTLIVAAAGNTAAAEPTFPARLAGVLAVGATDPSDKLAPFSNRGPRVPLYAPGVDISVMGTKGELLKQSGTSFSATVAAAVAASVWAARPTLSALQLRELLISTAVEVGRVDPAKPDSAKVRRIDEAAALQKSL